MIHPPLRLHARCSHGDHHETVDNHEYYTNGCVMGGGEEDMKEALHKDPTLYLNMYYTDCMSKSLFGFATFPSCLARRQQGG